jgi:hypothetical protein
METPSAFDGVLLSWLVVAIAGSFWYPRFLRSMSNAKDVRGVIAILAANIVMPIFLKLFQVCADSDDPYSGLVVVVAGFSCLIVVVGLFFCRARRGSL